MKRISPSRPFRSSAEPPTIKRQLILKTAVIGPINGFIATSRDHGCGANDVTNTAIHSDDADWPKRLPLATKTRRYKYKQNNKSSQFLDEPR